MCWRGWWQGSGSVSDHFVACSWLFVGATDGHGCGLQGCISCGERRCWWAAGRVVKRANVLEGPIQRAGAQLGLGQGQDELTGSTGATEGQVARSDSWVDWRSCCGGAAGD